MNFNLATDVERTKQVKLELETEIEQMQRDIEAIIKTNIIDLHVKVRTYDNIQYLYTSEIFHFWNKTF